MRHSLPPGAVALLGVLALWNCGGGGGTSSPTAPSAAVAPPAATTVVPPATPVTTTVSVSIVTSTGNQAFSPNPVRANAGDTVMFRNADATMHHLVLDDGSADFGDIAPGASSRGVVLRTASPLLFHCTLHATMVGSINGATAPDTPVCMPDIYGYGC
jgi:plastocyanin